MSGVINLRFLFDIELEISNFNRLYEVIKALFSSAVIKFVINNLLPIQHSYTAKVGVTSKDKIECLYFRSLLHFMPKVCFRETF